jgi:hypothetical protein
MAVTIICPRICMFYDFATLALVECSGENITLTDVNFLLSCRPDGHFTCARQRLGREHNDRIPIFPNPAFLPSSPMLDFYHFARVYPSHIQDNDSRVRVPLLLPFLGIFVLICLVSSGWG